MIDLQEPKARWETELLCSLKECSRTRNLQGGKQVHAKAIKCGYDSSVRIESALINMYAKCGSMEDARRVFDGMLDSNVVSWNALILGYAANGQGVTGLGLFIRMRSEGLAPESVTFVALLKACTSLVTNEGPCTWEKCGAAVHNLAVENGCGCNTYVQNTLLDLYAKCGSMVQARHVFDRMESPDVVSWNVLISGYAENGQGSAGLALLGRMRSEGTPLTSVTIVAAIKSCTSFTAKGDSGWRECSRRGKAVHILAGENRWSANIYVQSALIDMYSKCGSVVEACLEFRSMRDPDVVCWTALIMGYADKGEGDLALDLFIRMSKEGPAPNSVTFVAALKACMPHESATELGECMNRAKALHNIVIENSCSCNIFVENTLIDMYAKLGTMVVASQVFESVKHPDVVSWNALILGYADNGQGQSALSFFKRMKVEGPAPDCVTIAAALKACTCLGENNPKCRDRGKAVHNIAVENRCCSDVFVQSTLIDMYAKCGSMVEAHQVFDSMKHRNVVSWTALILGYADNGQGNIALQLFTRMRTEGPAPNSVTFLAALKACSLVGALELGRKLHLEIGSDANVALVTSLVDFYAKCGSLVEAKSVFDANPEARDAVTWNALLAGFSSSGDHRSAFSTFQGMQDAGFQPDGVTFQSMLACCSHAGLVDSANECLQAMAPKYGVTPTVEHYSCMIDAFRRARRSDDALALLRTMPCTADDATLRSVIKASFN